MRSLKKILLIVATLFLTNCKDNPALVIQESKENCACADVIKKVQKYKVDELLRKHVSRYGYGQGGVSFRDVDCNKPFFMEGENKQQYSSTKTLEIFNMSETKVYEVMVQYKKSGIVSYESFKIEPTRKIILGCNFEFNANLNKISDSDSSVNLKLMELTNFIPIEYKIHKISLLSEY